MIKDYPDLSASPFSPSATSPSATTTYTPYTPRSRRKLDEGPLPDIPVVASNSTGGITSRHIPSSYVRPGMSDSSGDSDDEDDLPPVPVMKEEKMERNLMQTRVRSLDDVQRLGRLVTLDLKGNDLRVRFFLSLSLLALCEAVLTCLPRHLAPGRRESLTSPRCSSGTAHSRSATCRTTRSTSTGSSRSRKLSFVLPFPLVLCSIDGSVAD